MYKKRGDPSDFLKKYYELVENNSDGEMWRDIELGDKPLYQISSHGRVRRIDNFHMLSPFHSYRKDSYGNFILTRPTYLRVQLYYYKDGKRFKKHEEISRLVAKAFIPIPKKYLDEGYSENELEVNHIKGGYQIYNNFVSNLEWCTSEENIAKAFETGLRNPPYGESHNASFLKSSDIEMICSEIENCIPVNVAYERIKNRLSINISYRIFRYTFYNIKYGISWKSISKKYKFSHSF